MDWGIFLAILIAVESGGDPTAVGDKHLRNKAYGVLQIRQPYLDDVNKHYKAVILEHWGRPLTLEDIKEPAIARWVTIQYLTHYGKRYTRMTGKKPTFEIYARMHNGGLNGWTEKRRPKTENHWEKFQRKAREYERAEKHSSIRDIILYHGQGDRWNFYTHKRQPQEVAGTVS